MLGKVGPLHQHVFSFLCSWLFPLFELPFLSLLLALIPQLQQYLMEDSNYVQKQPPDHRYIHSERVLIKGNLVDDKWTNWSIREKAYS